MAKTIPSVHDLHVYVTYPLLALLGFGFVIAIHELGHFVFAKWAGVRVETFSIGFGPVLLRTRRGETEYVLSLLPFGGYVRMTGQEDVPSGEAPETDPRSYLAMSAAWKALILFGGVLFNLVSSYLILLGLVAWGMPVFAPVVGDVQATVPNQDGVAVESPAARLGLKRGDRLVAVDGERVRSFDDVVTAVLFAGSQPLQLEVERAGSRVHLPAPGTAPVAPVFDGRFGRPSLGIEPSHSTRVVGISDPGEHGLLPLDRILTLAGEDVADLTGQALQDRLYEHFLEPVAVGVLRDGQRVEAQLTYAGPDGAFDTQIGLPVRVDGVSDAAERAGLKAGDWVRSVDGIAVCGQTHFLSLARRGIRHGGSVQVVAQRAGAEVTVNIVPSEVFGVQRLGVKVTRTTGVLPFLPTPPGGGPGALAADGMQAGDALVAWEPAENEVRAGWLHGQERLELPLGLDAAAWKEANQVTERSLLEKITFRPVRHGLAEQVMGHRVVAIDAEAVELAAAAADAKPARIERARLGPAAGQLQVGDWITDARLVDGAAVVEVLRGASAVHWTALAPTPIGSALSFDMEERPYQATSTGDAISLVNDAAYNLVVKSMLLIPRLFRSAEHGGVDPNKALNGPIGIFRELKARAERMGFDSFLKVVALVGLNLFIVNLLPIPITDGGQLLMLGIETAMRRPLPLRLRNALQWFGIALVGLLFLYISGLDILRWFGVI